MATRTFFRQSSLTHFLLFRTLETVPMVTPAIFATSLIVATVGLLFLFFSNSFWLKIRWHPKNRLVINLTVILRGFCEEKPDRRLLEKEMTFKIFHACHFF